MAQPLRAVMSASHASPQVRRSQEPLVWLVLLPPIAALGIACGVTVLLVTIFNYVAAPIARELGLSQAQTAGALSVHLAALIFALPAAGVLADRFGTRRVVLCSALAFGAALFWISKIDGGRASLYAAFAVAGVAGSGASPISYARAIVHRFNARRGLALGIALTGTGLGGIILPMFVKPIVMAHGWRAAFEVLACVAIGAGALAGLIVGGERTLAASADGGESTLRQAASHAMFWRMALAFALLAIVLSGVLAQLTSLWTVLGIGAEHVPRFQAIMGIATILGRLLGGVAMDRVPAHFVGASAALAGAAGMTLLAGGASAPWLIACAAVALGLCTGAESDVISFLSSRYFGLRNFSRIYAAQAAFFMIGFALGPVAAAWAFEFVGVRPTLALGVVLLVVSAVTLATLRAPTPAALLSRGADETMS